MTTEGNTMNGDAQKIYDEIVANGKRIVEIEVTQKLNHRENKKDISRLYKWLWALTILILGVSVSATMSAVAG